jgi:hypothetical protein
VPAPPAAPGFVARLKRDTVGEPTARYVYLNNFEVERSWARGEPALPGGRLSFATATVNRMEELGLLLADPGDVVVLKAAPDPGYAGYLTTLGLAGGETQVVAGNDPLRSVTEDALADPSVVDALAGLADGHTYLAPLGISAAEEELALRTGLPLAGPGAAVCKSVNGKMFSRRLVDATGLRPVPGAVCETVADLAAALDAHLRDGCRVVVKESLGVSGRGMVVLADRRRADRLLRMLARAGDDARVNLVAERWIERATDLNYQFVVSGTGAVRFETVKAAVVDRGQHRGHRFPVALPPDTDHELRRAAEVLGAELASAGYRGMVGVDAILDQDGVLYPCLEINARFNMSTYGGRVEERFVGPGRHAVAVTFDLLLARRHSFAELADALGGLLFDGTGAPGVLVSNFATLNAAATADGRQFAGRVYAFCVADDPATARALHGQAAERLQAMVARS